MITETELTSHLKPRLEVKLDHIKFNFGFDHYSLLQLYNASIHCILVVSRQDSAGADPGQVSGRAVRHM